MIIKDKMIITTTPNIEGWEIEAYYETIFSHVVAGTNIFSDIFASFSDIFGGRSKSYQNQLTSINKEAVELLEYQASRLGANAIVGLRIDHDSISGKGKSMFMVTAVGTAVSVKPNQTKIISNENMAHSVAISELEIIMKKNWLIEEASNENFNFDNDSWNFIIKNKVSKLVPIIIKKLAVNPTHAPDKFLNNCIIYFSNLSEDIVNKYIYDYLKTEPLFEILEHIIKECNLLDLSAILELLNSDSISNHQKALNLMQYNKLYYVEGDLEKLRSVWHKLDTLFLPKSEYYQKTEASSKSDYFWKCSCGLELNKYRKNCSSCGTNIYGLSVKDADIDKVKVEIDKKITALEEIFAGSDIYQSN